MVIWNGGLDDSRSGGLLASVVLLNQWGVAGCKVNRG